MIADERVTFCRICEAACGLRAEIGADGTVTRLRPTASIRSAEVSPAAKACASTRSPPIRGASSAHSGETPAAR